MGVTELGDWEAAEQGRSSRSATGACCGSNNITQGYTDIVPARPTSAHHRAPEHDLLDPYGANATLSTKLNALTLTGGEYQTHDYYMNIGPVFADPRARQLYAEIASIESQHITHYGSMLNPHETPLEKLMVGEACEVWNYACQSKARLRPGFSLLV